MVCSVSTEGEGFYSGEVCCGGGGRVDGEVAARGFERSRGARLKLHGVTAMLWSLAAQVGAVGNWLATNASVRRPAD